MKKLKKKNMVSVDTIEMFADPCRCSCPCSCSISTSNSVFYNNFGSNYDNNAY